MVSCTCFRLSAELVCRFRMSWTPLGPLFQSFRAVRVPPLTTQNAVCFHPFLCHSLSTLDSKCHAARFALIGFN
jgi:hypothetical protein